MLFWAEKRFFSVKTKWFLEELFSRKLLVLHKTRFVSVCEGEGISFLLPENFLGNPDTFRVLVNRIAAKIWSSSE